MRQPAIIQMSDIVVVSPYQIITTKIDPSHSRGKATELTWKWHFYDKHLKKTSLKIIYPYMVIPNPPSKKIKTSLCLMNQADRMVLIEQNYHQRGETKYDTRHITIQVRRRKNSNRHDSTRRLAYIS
jgi:hypothetical protein